MRGARLARLAWGDAAYADRLEQEATDLKRRFNQDFWVEEGEFFALALDADGRQVDSLTSNNGHLLWSGIVDDEKAEIVVRHLLGERLFSGWGIRTMAVGEGRYNPIGYHVGPSGHSITHSSRGVCAAMDSRTKPRSSLRESWRLQSSSMGGYQKLSVAIPEQ